MSQRQARVLNEAMIPDLNVCPRLNLNLGFVAEPPLSLQMVVSTEYWMVLAKKPQGNQPVASQNHWPKYAPPAYQCTRFTQPSAAMSPRISFSSCSRLACARDPPFFVSKQGAKSAASEVWNRFKQPTSGSTQTNIGLEKIFLCAPQSLRQPVSHYWALPSLFSEGAWVASLVRVRAGSHSSYRKANWSSPYWGCMACATPKPPCHPP